MFASQYKLIAMCQYNDWICHCQLISDFDNIGIPDIGIKKSPYRTWLYKSMRFYNHDWMQRQTSDHIVIQSVFHLGQGLSSSAAVGHQLETHSRETQSPQQRIIAIKWLSHFWPWRSWGRSTCWCHFLPGCHCLHEPGKNIWPVKRVCVCVCLSNEHLWTHWHCWDWLVLDIETAVQ